MAKRKVIEKAKLRGRRSAYMEYGAIDGDFPLIKKYNLEEVKMQDEEQLKLDKSDIISSLTVLHQFNRTYLWIIAKSKDSAVNKKKAIRCYRGVPFSKGYTYDQGSDSYLVWGVDSYELGYVDISYSISFPNRSWKVEIPIPDNVLDRHFSPVQKQMVEQFKSKWTDKDYEIEIIQMIGCDC